MGGVTFSQAIDGYLLYAHGRQLSEHTLADYGNTFWKFQGFLAPEDPPLDEITLDRIELFFAGLDGLTKKTLLNYHTGLSALKRRMVDEHVVKQFERPKPTKKTMEIFSEAEVQRLLDACDRTPACTRRGKRKCSNKRPTALRDKAIILTFLDSMARATELCEMQSRNSAFRLAPFLTECAGDGIL